MSLGRSSCTPAAPLADQKVCVGAIYGSVEESQLHDCQHGVCCSVSCMVGARDDGLQHAHESMSLPQLRAGATHDK